MTTWTTSKPRLASTPGPKPARPAPAQETASVSHETIRARAYELYLARTRLGLAGDDVTDWVQAERELGASPPAAPVIELKGQVRGETLLRSGQD